MPKFSTTIALELYEEDQDIQKDLSLLDAPELDSHWDDWFTYGLSIEPSIKGKIAVDEAEHSSNIKTSSNKHVILKKDTTARNRRINNARAKKRFLSTAKIASKNSQKREIESMHYTSLINGEEVYRCSHPYNRMRNLEKKADKLCQSKIPVADATKINTTASNEFFEDRIKNLRKNNNPHIKRIESPCRIKKMSACTFIGA